MSNKIVQIQRLQKICPNLDREVIEDIYDQVGDELVEEHLKELGAITENDESSQKDHNFKIIKNPSSMPPSHIKS